VNENNLPPSVLAVILSEAKDPEAPTNQHRPNLSTEKLHPLFVFVSHPQKLCIPR
jgi:hypothetical protein